MSFGEYTGCGAGTTKLLLHLNGSNIDSSGNGISSTDTSITYGKQYGKFNEGALFNGLTSRIYNSFALPTAYTLIVSFYNVGALLNDRYIAIKRNSANNKNYGFHTLANGALRMNSWNGSAGGVVECAAGTIIQNTWYRLVCVYNTNQSKMYVNGTLVGTGTVATLTPGTDTWIGTNAGGAGSFVAAYMDEVIFENRIWTPQEVQKDYTNILGRF